MEQRLAAARLAHARGWKLTPLNGKKPIQDEWQKASAPDLELLERWARRGNLGLRTGGLEPDEQGRHGSGLFVIDFDLPKLVSALESADGDAAATELAERNLKAARELLERLPATVTVVTGTGGLHKYFLQPPVPLTTSVAKLAPHVDTRGYGGQVVFVGSIHPETEQRYGWAPGFSPDEITIAELPEDVITALRPPASSSPAPATRPADDGDGSTYGKAALGRIYVAISTAARGARNAELNRQAFGAFQLLASGELRSEALVASTLYDAANACGLVADDGEASVRSTIESARRAGSAAPREAPHPRDPRRGLRAVPNHGGQPNAQAVNQGGAASGSAVESPAAENREDANGTHSAAPNPPQVLIPGLHRNSTDDLEVGNHDFTDAVLSTLPPGSVYRRGDVPGELVGEPGKRSFRVLTNDGMRLLLDRHVRMVQWIRRKSDAAPWLKYLATNSDHARLVLEAATTHPAVRSLRHVVSYPVFLSDLSRAVAGWNELGGVYYDEPPELANLEVLDHARTHAVLTDLVVDFPWKQDGAHGRNSASRENFFGLLLTPMLRPALIGNVPMHMLLSTIPRTGKSKLAEQVLGGVYLGHPTPARQIGSNEEEREKRIVSMLLQGDTIVHLDNLRDYLDSAHIASLLTSTEFSARRLGVNDTRPMPNNLILVASGNNVRATEEIVKRTVPVWLTPTRDDPENRTDFRHPDLSAYVAEQRAAVLGALVGMVERWRDGERPLGLRPKGGFERWAEIVGGVLLASAFASWRGNERAWARAADTAGEDLRTLSTAWWERHQGGQLRTGDVLDLIDELGVFPHVQKAKDRAGRLVSLARTVLTKYVDAPVDRWFLRRDGSGSNSYYRLEEMA